MTTINNIGGKAADAGNVISVEDRIGEVVLDDIYTKFGHLHSPVEIITSLEYTPEDQANKAIANGYASLDADGKIPEAELPDIAKITIFEVYEELAHLGLTVQQGDLCNRLDENKTYVALNSDNNSMADWKALLTSGGEVISVDGQVGVVDLSAVYAAINHVHYEIINNQAGNYQAVLTDASKIIEFNNGASDYDFTIPPNSIIPFPIGTIMTFRKTGAGEITITRGAGVFFRGALGDVDIKLDGQDGFEGKLEKTATNIWLITGAIKAV